DESVVELGLQIPVSLKIKSGVRKYVLREVAKNRGLPKSIWSREKKAIQYSTGVDKRVKKIIKKGV
ncbi:MAG TPA: asparagine synthase, partial [Euryarchaeota archaeon]|nr:asparagine synthase [Euryarchaeota archaeon]